MSTAGQAVVNQVTQRPTNMYWAAVGRDDIANYAYGRLVDFYTYIGAAGFKWRWVDTYTMYYRGAQSGGQLIPGGEQGELTTISINHFRAVLQHVLSQITEQDLSYEPQATTTDSKSLSQCIKVKGVLDYLVRHERIAEAFVSAAEWAVLFGQAFVAVNWDYTAGEVVSVDVNLETGIQTPIHAGKPLVQPFGPFDVAFDFSASTAEENQWYITREWVSKWDLAAQFGGKQPDGSYADEEMARKIRDSQPDYGAAENFRLGYWQGYDENDRIAKWTLWHARCPAIPDGRKTEFLAGGILLTDGPLPTKEVDLYRLSTNDLKDTAFGYSVAEDEKAVQRAIDGCDSTVLTNVANFGVTNYVARKDSAVTLESIVGGANLVLFEGDFEPHPMPAASTPPEIFGYRASLVDDLRQLASVPSAALGDPQESLKSYKALAFVTQQTLQFANFLNKSYIYMQRRVMTAMLRLLKENITEPRTMQLIGTAGKAYTDEMSTKDFESVDRVEVNEAPPLTKSLAGRVEFVQMINEMMKTNPSIKLDMSQFLLMLQTGRFDLTTEVDNRKKLLVRQENEMLMAGQTPRVLVTDDHPSHMKEHLAEMDSPAIRQGRPEDQAAVNAILNHVTEHKTVWASADPMILAAVGVPPFPAQVAMLGPGGVPRMDMLPQGPPQAAPGNHPPHPALQAEAKANTPAGGPASPAGVEPPNPGPAQTGP